MAPNDDGLMAKIMNDLWPFFAEIRQPASHTQRRPHRRAAVAEDGAAAEVIAGMLKDARLRATVCTLDGQERH